MREKEGEGLPNCAECLNLGPDHWCKARKRTVSGSRHSRKCELFLQGAANPKPERLGKPNHAHLVQCVACRYFAGWGACSEGMDYFGVLSPLIWRNCACFEPGGLAACCQSCIHLNGRVCTHSGQDVTNKTAISSCRLFTRV